MKTLRKANTGERVLQRFQKRCTGTPLDAERVIRYHALEVGRGVVSGDRKTRQQLRAEAREAAKLLVRTGKPKEVFRWDYTLGFFGVALGIILVVAPPRSRAEIIIWLIVMFVVLAYPALHIVRTVLHTKLK